MRHALFVVVPLALATLAPAEGFAQGAPVIQYNTALNLPEGSEKSAAIVVAAGACASGSPSVRFHQTGSTTWTNGSTPARMTLSGAPASTTVWRSRLPGTAPYRQGTVFTVEWQVPYSAGGRFCPRAGTVVARRGFYVRSAFTLSVTPHARDLPAGASRTVSVAVQRTAGFSAPVTVTFSGVPASVTAVPSTLTITGTPATVTFMASAAATATAATVTFDGAASGYTTQHATLSLRVAHPTISSVTPAVQLAGAEATINGSNFDAACANNVVRMGGTTITPATCTTTAIGFRVPATAAAGSAPIVVTTHGLSSNTLPFTVVRVTVTSVSPVVQTRGGNLLVNGTNFDVTCSNNLVMVAGMNVVPSSCSATALNVLVPVSAAYGPALVTVARYGVASNSGSFSVGRQTGAFVDITNDVNGEKSSDRSCSTGEVVVTVSGSFVASFDRVSGGNVGTIRFDDTTPDMEPYSGARPESLSDAGGAGFSLCNTGVVLDLDMTDSGSDVLGYRFLRLDDGTRFSFTFNYFSRVVTRTGTRYYVAVLPELHRSQDGTVFLVVVASDTTDGRQIVVVDRESGTVRGRIEIADTGVAISSATFTAANTVVITSGGTTFPPITIQ